MHKAPSLGGDAVVGKGPPPTPGDGKTGEVCENKAGFQKPNNPPVSLYLVVPIIPSA